MIELFCLLLVVLSSANPQLEEKNMSEKIEFKLSDHIEKINDILGSMSYRKNDKVKVNAGRPRMVGQAVEVREVDDADFPGCCFPEGIPKPQMNPSKKPLYDLKIIRQEGEVHTVCDHYPEVLGIICIVKDRIVFEVFWPGRVNPPQSSIVGKKIPQGCYIEFTKNKLEDGNK